MMKKIVVLCLVMMLAIAAASFAQADDRIFVAENDRLTLYLNADHCGFEVEDKQTGDAVFGRKHNGCNRSMVSEYIRMAG